jgi:hypothetical protein
VYWIDIYGGQLLSRPKHIQSCSVYKEEEGSIMVRKKINIAGNHEAGYQSCIKLWPMVEHAKMVFWHHHHTTSTAQSPEQPSRHKE